jgi:hypothetical protein
VAYSTGSKPVRLAVGVAPTLAALKVTSPAQGSSFQETGQRGSGHAPGKRRWRVRHESRSDQRAVWLQDPAQLLEDRAVVGNDVKPVEAESAVLTTPEALAANTDGQGTVAPGKRGDLALLEDDPLRTVSDSAAGAAHLRGMRVGATLVAGRATHLAI